MILTKFHENRLITMRPALAVRHGTGPIGILTFD